MKIKRRTIRNIIISALALAAAAGVYFWYNYNTRLQKLTQLERGFYTVQPDTGDVVVRVMGSGSVSAAESADLIPPASGTLQDFTVKDGDRVTKGQKLGTIVKNTETLEREIESLQNAIEQARLQINAYKAGYSERAIKAPIDGRIKSLKARAGEDASTTIRTFGYLTLISTERKMVATFVPPDGAVISEGDTLSVALEDGSVINARVIKSNNAYAYSDSENAEEISAGLDSQPSPTMPPSNMTELEQMLDELLNGGQGVAGAELYADFAECMIEIDLDDLPLYSKIIIMSAAGEKLGEAELSLKNYVAVSGNGLVTKLNVSENAMVSRGDRLFTLSSADISRSIEAINLQIGQNEAMLTRKQEQAQTSEEAFVSPASGIVTQIGVRDGNDVYANRSVGMVLIVDGLEAIVTVDELDILKVFTGQRVVATADAMPDEPFSGTVTRISDIGSPGANAGGVATFDVAVALDAPELLKVGMSVSVDIEAKVSRDVMRIPLTALRYTNDGYSVLMASFLADEEATPKASGVQLFTSDVGGTNQEVFERHLRHVEVGLINEDYAEIISGLSFGDEILVESGAENILDFLLGT